MKNIILNIGKLLFKFNFRLFRLYSVGIEAFALVVKSEKGSG
jgi:hypothetical protein